jgi:hypothetical protein
MVFTTSNIDVDDWIEIFEDYLEIKNELRSGSREFVPVSKRNLECGDNYKIRNNKSCLRQSPVQDKEMDYSGCGNSENSSVSFQNHSGMNWKQQFTVPEKKIDTELQKKSAILAKPKAKIIIRGRLKHSVEFNKINSCPGQTADIKGCEIWYKIEGGGSADETGYKYLSTDTNSPHIVSFRKEHIGKIVSYKLRWVNNRNETGPWSETVSARIRFIPDIRIRPDIFILIFQKLIM